MSVRFEATVELLEQIKQRAEIINGQIILMPPNGALPGYVAGEIFYSLRLYSKHRNFGHAVSDNRAFIVNLPHRKSFSPHAGFYIGELTTSFSFYQGAPVFAVEIRNLDDYGPKVDRQFAQKRADYFAAGTLVVWNIDLLNDDIVRVYRASDPDTVTIYRRGEIAEAEPAVPGWTIPVDDLFPERTPS
jgi:Uma2 family endonuclease